MLFKDNALYENYLRDGFVKLTLYDSNELAELKRLYDHTVDKNLRGLSPSLRHGDAEDNIRIHHEIGKITESAIAKHFKEFDFVACHFISKSGYDENEFRLHQDWNVVDESKFIAAHIWAPLQYTDPDNGGLFVIKGSHNFFNNYRSGSLGIPFIDSSEKVKRNILSFNLEAGEAIAYNQRLFHGSHPNPSNEDRKVVLCSIKPVIAPFMYFQKKGIEGRSIEIEPYEITSDVLFREISYLEKGLPPGGAAKRNESIIYWGTISDEIHNELFEGFLV